MAIDRSRPDCPKCGEELDASTDWYMGMKTSDGYVCRNDACEEDFVDNEDDRLDFSTTRPPEEYEQSGEDDGRSDGDRLAGGGDI